MNILAHDHAFAQGKYKPPTYIFEHFVRILFKYASFSTLPYFRTYLTIRDMAVRVRETPN